MKDEPTLDASEESASSVTKAPAASPKKKTSSSKKKNVSKPKAEKKKSPQKAAETVSQPTEEVIDVPVTPTFILPVQPDEWFILPAETDTKGNILQEERFVFLQGGVEIISLPYTESNFSGLLAMLNNSFAGEDLIPDHWTINEPLNAEIDPDPVMALTKNGKLLAATSLDQDALKKMVRALERHIIKPPTFNKAIGKWWMKHKVLRVLASLALLPIFMVIIYAFIWGLQN